MTYEALRLEMTTISLTDAKSGKRLTVEITDKTEVTCGEPIDQPGIFAVFSERGLSHQTRTHVLETRGQIATLMWAALNASSETRNARSG